MTAFSSWNRWSKSNRASRPRCLGRRSKLCRTAAHRSSIHLLIDNEHAVAVARFLRVDPALCFDFCSNVTGVDWPDRVVKKTTKVKKVVDGQEKEIVETTEEKIPGYLEAVYHLYSMTHKHGPVIIRMRTRDRAEGARLPSLTPIWRSAEFQEREIFDLYGIHFDGSSRSAPDFNVGRVSRSSDAERLP